MAGCKDETCKACEFDARYLETAVQPETNDMLIKVSPIFSGGTNAQVLCVVMNIMAQQILDLAPEDRRIMMGLMAGCTVRLAEGIEGAPAQGHA